MATSHELLLLNSIIYAYISASRNEYIVCLSQSFRVLIEQLLAVQIVSSASDSRPECEVARDRRQRAGGALRRKRKNERRSGYQYDSTLRVVVERLTDPENIRTWTTQACQRHRAHQITCWIWLSKELRRYRRPAEDDKGRSKALQRQFDTQQGHIGKQPSPFYTSIFHSVQDFSFGRSRRVPLTHILGRTLLEKSWQRRSRRSVE